MKKSLILLVVILLLIGILPFGLGFFAKDEIGKQLKDIETAINEPDEYIQLNLVKHKIGYLQSDSTISIKIISKGDIKWAQTISVKSSNLPDFSELLNSKLKFDFLGKMSTIELDLTAKNNDNKNKDVPDFDMFSLIMSELKTFKISDIEVRGSLFLPNELQVGAFIPNISTANKNFSIENLGGDFFKTKDYIKHSIGYRSLKLGMMNNSLVSNKLLISGKQGRGKNSGGEVSFELSLDSPQFKLNNGIRLDSKLRYNYMPTIYKDTKIQDDLYKELEANNFKIDAVITILVGDSRINLNGVGKVEKHKKDKTKYQFVGDGDILIDFKENDKKNQLLSFLLVGLNDQATDFKSDYDIDLLSNPVKFSFNLEGRRLTLNGRPYYHCLQKGIDNKKYKIIDFAQSETEQILNEAIEDFFAEEHEIAVAKSYCGLKYITTVKEPENKVALIFENLFNLKKDYNNYSTFPQMFKAQVENLKALFEDSSVPVELNILVGNFNCLMNSQGKLCIEQSQIIPQYKDEHPFKKILGLYFNENSSLDEMLAFNPKEDSPLWIKKIYNILKIKKANKTLDNGKFIGLLKSNEGNFTKNFITYETLLHQCTHKKCTGEFKDINPQLLPTKLKNIYINGQISEIEKLKNDCIKLKSALAQLWIKLATTQDLNSWKKPDWWINNFSIKELESLCSKEVSLPTGKAN